MSLHKTNTYLYKIGEVQQPEPNEQQHKVSKTNTTKSTRLYCKELLIISSYININV
ncbi:hypothetical protein Hanom_Chr15g01357431 [Helianthus anomalus]